MKRKNQMPSISPLATEYMGEQSKPNQEAEILLGIYTDVCYWARHFDAQISVVASLLLSIDAAIIAVSTFDKFLTKTDIPLFLFIIMLSIFGVLFTKKLSMAFKRQICRADQLKLAIQELNPLTRLTDIFANADRIHESQSETVENKIDKEQLHTMWLYLHVFIGLIGCLLIVLAFIGLRAKGDIN